MFFSSKRSRKKWVARLTSEGVDEVRAHQIAWAAFPFDDSQRPRNRGFAKTVRSESFKFVREHDVNGDKGHALAVETLQRWASLARREQEMYYATVYEVLADGQVPPTGREAQQVESEEQRYRRIQEAGVAAREQMTDEEIALVKNLGDEVFEVVGPEMFPVADIPTWMTRETYMEGQKKLTGSDKIPRYIEEEFDRRERESTS